MSGYSCGITIAICYLIEPRPCSGDVVLVAGKGHEAYQVIGTEKRPFDDREEVKRHFGFRGLI